MINFQPRLACKCLQKKFLLKINFNLKKKKENNKRQLSFQKNSRLCGFEIFISWTPANIQPRTNVNIQWIKFDLCSIQWSEKFKVVSLTSLKPKYGLEENTQKVAWAWIWKCSSINMSQSGFFAHPSSNFHFAVIFQPIPICITKLFSVCYISLVLQSLRINKLRLFANLWLLNIGRPIAVIISIWLQIKAWKFRDILSFADSILNICHFSMASKSCECVSFYLLIYFQR